MIAGRYPVNWNQIDSFFPYLRASIPLPHYYIGSSMGTVADVSLNISKQAAAAQSLTLSKWNWGAYGLSWIWGFFNGCWWMFLVKFGILLLYACFLGFPLSTLFFTILDLCTSILFGVKGMEWAWNNRSWESISCFQHTQNIWNKIGLSLYIAGMVITLFIMVYTFIAITKNL